MSTWVVDDIHGCYDKFMKLLENKEIKDEDTIIIIGDIIDRNLAAIRLEDQKVIYADEPRKITL